MLMVVATLPPSSQTDHRAKNLDSKCIFHKNSPPQVLFRKILAAAVGQWSANISILIASSKRKFRRTYLSHPEASYYFRYLPTFCKSTVVVIVLKSTISYGIAKNIKRQFSGQNQYGQNRKWLSKNHKVVCTWERLQIQQPILKPHTHPEFSRILLYLFDEKT